MNKINYFQQGGAVAPASTPALGGEDIQTQIIQLVQAAMSGDQQASKAIELIMQAAQQGDQLAAQLALMIQEVAKQMQGQAQTAKRGAKLSYIHALKSGCPEGYEVSYRREGGKICKECVAKAAQKPINTPGTDHTNFPSFDKSGGNLKKKLACGGKKTAQIDKCGGKAKKADCPKKCANGGTLTLEALLTAYKNLGK